MFTKSLFLELINRGLSAAQNSRAASFARDSLVFQYIDFLIWAVFALTIFSTCCFSSGIIGGLALLFVILNIFRLFIKKGEMVKISKLDAFFIIYFFVLIIALFGSSLFALSFKGFLKNITYFLFYFAAVYFFLNNKKKILPTMFLIAVVMSYESVVAIFQHFNKVEALAGWVDTSRMSNENQLMSRAFGTLKPSNPNLLGGYLITGLSCILAFFGINFVKKDKLRMGIFGGLFVLNLIAIIFTGCRGAYLGLVAIFVALGAASFYYVKKVYGSFSNIKKRYKNLIIGLLGAGFAICALTPSISRRFLSIFQFRGDSSISFRMNVYEASFDMFQDNPFLGIGLGNLNFREIYGLYMKTGFDALGTYCVPLEIAVEGGIFALIAFLTMIIYGAYKAVKFILDKQTPDTARVILFCVLITIFGTMAHGMFDTVWFRPQLQIIFWINIAILNTYIINRNTAPQGNLRVVK